MLAMAILIKTTSFLLLSNIARSGLVVDLAKIRGMIAYDEWHSSMHVYTSIDVFLVYKTLSHRLHVTWFSGISVKNKKVSIYGENRKRPHH